MDKNTSVTFYVNKKRHFAFLKRKQRKILRFVVTEFVKTCDELVPVRKFEFRTFPSVVPLLFLDLQIWP